MQVGKLSRIKDNNKQKNMEHECDDDTVTFDG